MVISVAVIRNLYKLMINREHLEKKMYSTNVHNLEHIFNKVFLICDMEHIFFGTLICRRTYFSEHIFRVEHIFGTHFSTQIWYWNTLITY